jgi:hypothetical protein
MEMPTIQPVCAGCGKPIQVTGMDTQKTGDNQFNVNIKVDWREHAMCAAAMLKSPGQG